MLQCDYKLFPISPIVGLKDYIYYTMRTVLEIYVCLTLQISNYLGCSSCKYWLAKGTPFVSLQPPVFTISHLWNQQMTLRRTLIMHVCLQGSRRKGQQFGVTVETFTSSCQQNKCRIVPSKRPPSNFDCFVVFRGSLCNRPPC